mmetsp:Transcript_78820/g.221181  ORF Transcript_78820/g.221181 Transcript_78820/m.221181 type:complete len:131 (-) Transcript_78820:120-512(-)
MDPLLTANLQAFVAHRPTATAQPSLGLGSTANDLGSTRRDFERQKLLEQRRKRGSMVFMDRMEVDASKRAALQKVSAMRQDADRRLQLDRMVERMRPAPEKKGPIVTTYGANCLWEGHNRNLNWAPLECY